ncbi:tetratricopeptide repeat protein [Staphylococcus chromogenes]|uniref:Tetratricopeptide repeat protein n=1 Tax=Staphylococcus chromogenes TaxID=46126 RepID=A0AAE5W970_STACR|nr:tetratricopeptide repeat protein [Staphylococcus chromogenes]MBV5190446.1 tetratricopeptide repeat protein [Staphylococcus chromogenes]MBW3132740.1 tetratricopeptide repeat protein [Staphylococcus chromogenes]MCE5004100.1 tetratricopeptide repeat protein [Staphylococcus chromogenes]MDQ7176006.1 tetratricopeptide repeat protein [Staphylococcus chromogenes]MDT0654615.1 tetratricopeptide repeat protein [Staphylococcus chromogenes]
MQDIYKLIDDINLQKLDDLDSRVQEALQSDDDEGLFALGETLYQYGLTPQGLEVFRTLYHKYPNEGEVLIYFIEGLVTENHIDEALEYLNEVPETPEKLMLEADLYQQINMLEVAIDKLEAALEIQPNDPIIHFALAELLYFDGQYLRASREYDTVLESGEYEVNGINLFSRLADSSLQSGNYQDALKWYDEINEQELVPEDYLKKAVAYEKNDRTQEAIKITKTLLNKDPDFIQAYYYLQQLYENEKMFADAIEIGDEGLRLNQYYKELMFSTGALKIEHGDQNEAVSLLKQALEVDPSYQEPLLMLADLYRHEEDYEALIELVQFVNEEDMDPVFIWQLAYALGQEERDKEAQHFYDIAYTSLKDNVDFLKDYYEYLIEISQIAHAKTILDLLIHKEPNQEKWQDEYDRLN